MNKYFINALAIYAVAKAGADEMQDTLYKRAMDKWEQSKLLPRKAKKHLRKDAQADYSLYIALRDTNNRLFNFF